MEGVIVEKNQMPRFLDDLIKEYKVYAPINKDGLTCFGEVLMNDEVNQNFQSKISSKEILFPRCEILFRYKQDEKEVILEEPQVEDKMVVLFGIPPCEARASALINKAYTSGEFQDVYYLSRKGNTIIIGKSCECPRNTCFCTSVGGSPFGKEGLDLLLQDLGNKYLLEVVSQRGQELINKLEGYENASQKDLIEAQHIAKAAEEAIKSKLLLQDLEEKLDKMFNDPVWDTIYQKCVGCGACTYLCPTCYCFDIVDESEGAKGQRMRIWDSCQFPIFTLQGSGENPRPTGKERMRQRILHKFTYYPKNYGGIACVGCGRCIQECPVNLDIREILKMIMTK